MKVEQDQNEDPLLQRSEQSEQILVDEQVISKGNLQG